MEALFEGMSIWLNFVLFVVGAVIITKAADCFVDAAVNISIHPYTENTNWGYNRQCGYHRSRILRIFYRYDSGKE